MLIDAVSAAYVACGVYRGRKRGLSDEAYRLLRLGGAFASGCGLHGLVSGGLDRILSLGGGVSGPVAFVGTMAGSWWALRLVKRRFLEWAAARFEPYIRIGGAVAGGLRAAILALSLLGAFSLATHAPGHDVVQQGSWMGRFAAWIVQAD